MSYVDNNGVSVWWNSVGSGEPIVLISGFTSDSGAWFRVIPHLKDEYKVITFDNRGTGRTGAPRGAYTYALMAGDVAKVVEAAGEISAHIIGISMGSCVAQEFALNYPDKVRTLTLVSSNPGVKSAVLPSMKIRAQVGCAAISNSRLVHNWLESLTYQPTTSRERVAEDTQRRIGLGINRRGLLNQLRGAAVWDRSTELGSITAATLVLHGYSDSIDPVENARILANKIPGAKLVILPDTNHQVFTDSEQASMKVIKDFIGSHRVT